MCGGGGGSYDYGAAQRAAEAEAAKLEAEKALEERKAELKTLADKQAQTEAEATARAQRRELLSKAAAGDATDDEEDLLNPTTRTNAKKTQTILASAS